MPIKHPKFSVERNAKLMTNPGFRPGRYPRGQMYENKMYEKSGPQGDIPPLRKHPHPPHPLTTEHGQWWIYIEKFRTYLSVQFSFSCSLQENLAKL